MPAGDPVHRRTRPEGIGYQLALVPLRPAPARLPAVDLDHPSAPTPRLTTPRQTRRSGDPPSSPRPRKAAHAGRIPWLNAVEGFFAKLTKRRLRRGVFGSLVELQAAINRFLAETNGDPKPFVGTAKPEHILEKVRPGNQALDAIH